MTLSAGDQGEHQMSPSISWWKITLGDALALPAALPVIERQLCPIAGINLNRVGATSSLVILDLLAIGE